MSLSPESLLAFVLAMFLLSLSPGPGFLVVVGRALAGGFAAGLAAVTGLVLGDIVFLLLAILGLSTLASVMGEFFLVVKILGAAYLVWLGVKTWRSRPALPRLEEPKAARKAMPPPMSHWRSALLGFLVTLGNPKVILFYGALLPTFIDVAALTTTDTAVMSAVVTAILFLVLGTYAFLAARAGRLVKSSRAVTWLNRVTGGLLVGASIAVAAR